MCDKCRAKWPHFDENIKRAKEDGEFITNYFKSAGRKPAQVCLALSMWIRKGPGRVDKLVLIALAHLEEDILGSLEQEDTAEELASNATAGMDIAKYLASKTPKGPIQ